MLHGGFIDGVLGHVGGVEVLWSVDVSAEHEVVELSDVTFIQVLSNEKLEQLFRGRDQTCLLHGSSELLNSNMTALGLVEVHELRFDKNSLVLDLASDCCQELAKGVKLSLRELSGRF